MPKENEINDSPHTKIIKRKKKLHKKNVLRKEKNSCFYTKNGYGFVFDTQFLVPSLSDGNILPIKRNFKSFARFCLIQITANTFLLHNYNFIPVV